MVFAEQLSADDPKVEVKVNKQKPTGAVYRSESILDMQVRNSAGEELGELDDLVVSLSDGEIRYAALSFGGFLGFGDKLFAVPWQALKVMRSDDEAYLVLDVSEETLERAPGFDKDKWPSFADTSWSERIDKFYGDKVKRKNGSTSDAIAVRLSKINEITIYDVDDKQIGEIEDVVVDVDQGKVRYVAVEFEPHFASGEKLFAMPWQTLQLKRKDGAVYFALKVDRATMKAAKGFDQDNWPNFADEKWQNETNQQFKLKIDDVKLPRRDVDVDIQIDREQE